jgi:putative flippase GtrA
MRQLGPTAIRYVLVAILAYLVDIGVFALLFHAGLASISVANVIAKVATAVFGFFGHRYVTFQLSGSRGMAKEAIKYFTLAALYAPLTTALLLLLVPVFPTTTIAKIVADTIGVVASFTISKAFIFQKRSDNPDLSKS